MPSPRVVQIDFCHHRFDESQLAGTVTVGIVRAPNEGVRELTFGRVLWRREVREVFARVRNDGWLVVDFGFRYALEPFGDQLVRQVVLCLLEPLDIVNGGDPPSTSPFCRATAESAPLTPHLPSLALSGRPAGMGVFVASSVRSRVGETRRARSSRPSVSRFRHGTLEVALPV